MCGKIYTENVLNAGTRPQDADRTRITSQNQVGQKKKEKESENEKGRGIGPAYLGRSWERIKTPTSWEIPWNRGGILESQRRTQQLV